MRNNHLLYTPVPVLRSLKACNAMPWAAAGVQVSWVQPRVLTLEQAGGLKSRLDAWISKVSAAALTLEEERLGTLEA
jgi:hypothetical protein